MSRIRSLGEKKKWISKVKSEILGFSSISERWLDEQMFKYVSLMAQIGLILLSRCSLNTLKQVHPHFWAFACPNLQHSCYRQIVTSHEVLDQR